MTVVSDATCRDSYGQSDIADSMICVEGALCFLSCLLYLLHLFVNLFAAFVCLLQFLLVCLLVCLLHFPVHGLR